MDSSGRDVQSTTYGHSDDARNNSTSRNIIRTRTRSASMSVPARYQDEQNTARRDALIQMSGPLICHSNNEFVFNPPQVHRANTSNTTNSGSKIKKSAVQKWIFSFYIICGFFRLLVDQTFSLLLSVNQDNKCITWNVDMRKIFILLRRIAEIILLLYLLQKALLNVLAPKTRPKGARHYVFACLYIVLLCTTIISRVMLPDSVYIGYDTRMFLKRADFVQDLLPSLMLIGLALSKHLTDSGLTGLSELDYCVSYLFSCVLLCYFVGCSWYRHGLKRVNDCFIDACRHSNSTNCEKFIYCGDLKSSSEADYSSWLLWKNNEDAAACFGQGRLDFGIFQNAVKLTTHESFMTRYAYSLFWAFQQFINAASNLVPSCNTAEVIFAMQILVGGVFFYAYLIPNMLNILQALGRRKLEMTLRTRDIEQLMRRHHLPEELRSHVRDAERFFWAATRGVKEEMLMENLPEDLQRDIRQHICQFILNVPILQGLDEPIVDAICERLKTKTYVKGSKILCQSKLIDKIVFIIEGKMESTGENGIAVPLAEGDVCGEELLTWFLEHSSINEDGRTVRISGDRLLSSRLVRCLTNVKASVLLAADLVEVASLFSIFLARPRVQGAIRYEAPYSRGRAIRRIQVSRRRRKKKNGRVDAASSTTIQDELAPGSTNGDGRRRATTGGDHELPTVIPPTIDTYSRKEKSLMKGKLPLKSASKRVDDDDIVNLPRDTIDSLSEHCRDLFDTLLGRPDRRHVSFSCDMGNVYYNPLGQVTAPVIIDMKDIREILKRESLDSSVIQVFLRYLNDELNSSYSFRFLNPSRIHLMIQENANSEVDYLAMIFKELHDSCNYFLVPYCESNHWVLLVIDFLGYVVYVFDSMAPKSGVRSLTVRRHLNLAMKSATQHGSIKRKKVGVQPSWKACKCPQQPKNTELCGFYIMRFMYDIMRFVDDTVSHLHKIFEDLDYDDEMIDEVRELWASHFKQTCMET